MYINNKHISNYNISLLETERGIKRQKIDLGKFNNNYTKNKKTVDGFEYYIRVLIKADNNTLLEKHISNLSKLISECAIQEAGFDFIYDCILESENIEKYDYDIMENKEMAIIQYNFFVKNKFQQEKVIEFKNNIKLILNNTETTPCTIELTPTQDLVDATITGLGEDIIIKNLTKDKKIVIDGEKGLVTENGLNKWKDYDSWSFPKLSPGENNISINKASIDAKLSYKARWI